MPKIEPDRNAVAAALAAAGGTARALLKLARSALAAVLDGEVSDPPTADDWRLAATRIAIAKAALDALYETVRDRQRARRAPASR